MTESSYNSDSDERYCMLIRWLKDTGIDYQQITAASSDASFRRYFRLYNDAKTHIAVDAPPEHEDNQRFIDIANRLRDSGLQTPKVICYSLEKGFLVVEDLGNTVLQQALQCADSSRINQLYTGAFDCISTMQSKTSTTDLPHYDAELLRTEMQLFPDWYLRHHLQYQTTDDEPDVIEAVFNLCINNATQQPQSFVHRDFHCRNLLIQPDLAAGIIDFQDAVKGPVTYDPVSLLLDAYIDWPDEFIHEFANKHRLSLTPVPSAEQYERWFDLMGLQRHIKILGIFSRLYHRDGKSQYLNDIPLVLKHIFRTTKKYPELTAFHQLLIKITRTTH